MKTMTTVSLLVCALAACKSREPERLPQQLPPPKVPLPAISQDEADRSEAGAAAEAATAEKEAEAPEPPVEEPGEDILAEVRSWQEKPYPKPPTKFRKGHVTPKKHLPAAKVTKDGGFELRMPSNAPITTPTFYDGKIFVSGGFRSKEFYAFDAKTGKAVWGLDLDDDGPSTAACADGKCAFNTESCTIFTVDANTGKLLWSAWLGDPLTSAPAIADGRVFTSYPAGGHAKASHVLIAFDLDSGKIEWQRWIDSDIQSAPVVADGKVFASSFGGNIYRFDPKSGEILSARKVRATSAPTVVDGQLLYSLRAEGDGEAAAEALAIVGGDGKARRTAKKSAVYLDSRVQDASKFAAAGLALDAANGFGGGAPSSANAQAAKHNVGKANVSTMQAHQGSRMLAFANNIVAAMGDEVVCSDSTTGERLWSYKVKGDLADSGGALVTAPAAAGGSVFVGTLEGEVLRMDPEGGKVQTRFAVGAPVRSQPIMADGWIYVGTENGRLVAIDSKSPDVTGWETWGGDSARTGLAKK